MPDPLPPTRALPPPDPAQVIAPTPPPHVPTRLEVITASVGLGGATGAVAGFLWGGVGGRIAMRIVFLTSSDHVRGLTSDDGFEIGTVSGATVFLLVAATLLGAMGGVVVGLLRTMTAGPTWAVALGASIAAAAWVGGRIVHADGVDFRFLRPLWLTVGLFVLIPGLWAASVVLATDRLLGALRLGAAPASVRSRSWGVLGWLVLVGVTVAGVRELVADIGQLT